jgi:hypothetical protein
MENLVWLERTVLPTGLQKLPKFFFTGCWRLSSIDTSRTALEVIGYRACDECRSLTSFPFPQTIRCLEGRAFGGTSITTIDLSDTMAEEVSIYDMTFLVDLVLPRRCVLEDVCGMPSLRHVTFGASKGSCGFVWRPTELRVESLAADAGFSRTLLEARVYGEVACELGCETLPFPPP